MNSLIYIAIAVNLIGFIQMGIDKSLSIKGHDRLREAQLLAPVLFSGIVGVVLGMLVFHHKTAKRHFQFKLAAAFAIFAGGIYLAYF